VSRVNRVVLIGKLGADPQVERDAPAEPPRCVRLTVATSRPYRDETGRRQTRTEHHPVTVTGQTADHCARQLWRGRWVFVDGRLETQRWQDAEGVEQIAAEVRATRVVFLQAPGLRLERRCLTKHAL
jgi:single-strand DNA-binding protein